MNRTDLRQRALNAADHCLKTKRHIALVDVFIEIGRLSRQDYDAWRHGRVPYLERVITLNLSQINEACRTVHANSRKGGLKASWTAYVKRGKGSRPPLRFTKSGNAVLERQWATHYLSPNLAPSGNAPESDSPVQNTRASAP